jgi:hypothetical protein
MNIYPLLSKPEESAANLRISPDDLLMINCITADQAHTCESGADIDRMFAENVIAVQNGESILPPSDFELWKATDDPAERLALQYKLIGGSL